MKEGVMMKYPKIPSFQEQVLHITYAAKYKHESGSNQVDELLKKTSEMLDHMIQDIMSLEEIKNVNEPSDYFDILELRPNGPRKMIDKLPPNYTNQLQGAFFSRIAGCILGSPVEFYSIPEMKSWAKYTNQSFPPTSYWHRIKQPYQKRYEKSDFISYTQDGMTHVPVDDDLVYTILNLMIVEEYGHNFTTQQVGEMWKTYLPYACTAEDVALQHLKKGMDVSIIGDTQNPYKEWIGAMIRSDAFAYIAPGYPELAAKMAYYDAYLSHRKNGIYGEMLFAAAQSAAFVVEDPLEAIRIGLTEIPNDCQLAVHVKWALDIAHTVTNYQVARELVDSRFGDMEHAHTINNACLVVFALAIGNGDITKTIGECVAMGLDNDCTAATAGSIVGAISTIDQLDTVWYQSFHNKIDTYLNGIGVLNLQELLRRFEKQAKIVYK